MKLDGNTLKAVVNKKATATYTNVGDYAPRFEGDKAASACSVTVNEKVYNTRNKAFTL